MAVCGGFLVNTMRDGPSPTFPDLGLASAEAIVVATKEASHSLRRAHEKREDMKLEDESWIEKSQRAARKK